MINDSYSCTCVLCLGDKYTFDLTIISLSLLFVVFNPM